ncbi:MAG: hypothetical protein IPK82_40725 [Polyangiaceae bacterium]|nr:hypothetical protein [Polyangiaceae bacterium]
MASDTPEGSVSPPAPKKKKRRALKIAAYMLGVPLLLVALVVGYLHTDAGKTRIKGVIVKRLADRVDGQVEVGTVDYALFGQIQLGELHLKDPQGVEAIGLTSLVVKPSWGDLLRGNLVLNEVSLRGAKVSLVKDADGGSNIKRLFKPQPENPNKKPLDKRITVKTLSISDVGVSIVQPDGTVIQISNAAIDGALSVLPSDKNVDVEIGKIALAAHIDKGQGGLKVGLSSLTTGLTVKLDKGVGKATLHPLSGHVALTLPDKPEKGFDIGLAGFSADISDDGVGVSLDKLLAGAVALASVEVKGKLADGKMAGDQKADVLGLKVRAASVNEILGKDILAGDVDIDTHVSGPPDKITLDSKVTAPGVTLALAGSVGVGDPSNPNYDVNLTLSNVDTQKLLASGMNAPSVQVEELKAAVKGRGQKAETAGATASIKVTGVTAKGVRVDGLDLEGELKNGILHVKSAEIKAVGQRVTAAGEVELATKRVNLTLGVDGDVGDALGRLKAAGIAIKSNLPKGAVRLPPNDLTVTVRGFLNGQLDVTANAKRLSVFGGTLGLNAQAALTRHDPPLEDGKKVTVSSLDTDIRIAGIKLSSILAMRGKKLQGIDGEIAGDIHVEGTPQSPKAKLVLGLSTSREDGGKTLRMALSGDVNPSAADLKVSLVPTGEAAEVFGLTAKLPLSLGGAKKGIDPYRPLKVHASLPKKALADLWAFVPKTVLSGTIQTLPQGDISLDLDVNGTAAKPDAKLHLGLMAKAVPGFDIFQKVDVDATLKPAGERLAVRADIGAWLDSTKAKLIAVGADVDLSRSPVLGPPDLGYKAEITLGPVLPADLFMASPETRAMGGMVLGAIQLQGNREDLTAHVAINGDGLKPGGKGPFALNAALNLEKEETDLTVNMRIPEGGGDQAKSDLLKLSGKIGLAGKKLFAQLKDKEHLDPKLDLLLSIPKRTLASLSVLRPNLEKAPGNLSGSIAVTGTAKSALAKGGVVLDDVERVDGQKGGAVLSLNVGAEQISVVLGAGEPNADTAPLKIAASLSRSQISKLREGGNLPIDASIAADKVDIRRLIPKAALENSKVGVKGTLDWNMNVHAELTKTDAGMKLAEGSVKGLLDLHDATLALPGTKRAYQDVGLKLLADDKGLHLDALKAKESDEEVKDRSLLAKAEITLDKLKPTAASLSLSANKWLVFGPRAIGFADAPRGTLSADIGAEADLSKPVRKVKVSVKALELLIPERFERAHQPEDVQAGDLIILDEGKVAKGKLPVPDSVANKGKEAPKEAKAAEEEESGLDLSVHIADGAHLLQAPIEIWPKGEVTVKSRPSGREVNANLTITRGGLSLGGQNHGLVKGSLVFDKANPQGFLDLYFEHPMRAAALRQISEASGGTSVKIHMFGPLSDRKTVLSGAGTSGALWDVLAMHNTGRARYVSEPDLPWSMSTEFPQHDNLLVLGFLAVNLPHLLFVDRFAAWGDPYDDPQAYGKITHFEAERFVGNALRFRVGARPSSPGQSDAEVELDYVFVNVPRMLLGVGAVGGTRGGGGAGFVWEVSSKD